MPDGSRTFVRGVRTDKRFRARSRAIYHGELFDPIPPSKKWPFPSALSLGKKDRDRDRNGDRWDPSRAMIDSFISPVGSHLLIVECDKAVQSQSRGTQGLGWSDLGHCVSWTSTGVPSMVRRPLIIGFGDRVMWTAGPVSAPLCNSAYWREQAEASFSFFWRAPYELLARSYRPGLLQIRRAHRDPSLLQDVDAVSWKAWRTQRLRFAQKAILQDLDGIPDLQLNIADSSRAREIVTSHFWYTIS